MTFPELHVRSAFSFLRGASSPEALVERAVSLEIPAMVLIDHDGVYGAPRFERAARSRGITPLLGASVAVHDGDLRGRLALLCTSRLGYQNLCALLTVVKSRVTKSDAREGRATASLDDLARHREGLIALLTAADAPLAGLGARWMGPHRDAALHWGEAMVGLYGRHGVAIEVTRHHQRAEERRTQRLLALAAHLGVPAAASGDARYAEPRDAMLHDVLTCIREHVTLDDAGKHLAPGRSWHLRAPRESLELFRDLPDAVQATRDLVARCAFTLRDLGYEFPEFPLPKGETDDSYLSVLTWKGFKNRYATAKPDVLAAARMQVEHELALIAKLRLAGYFLIVWDLVRFCAEQKILTQGRGSAANSVVCYSLGITAVDPIKLELLFERFLSEEREEWPDIDLDLPSGDQRERVIQYVYQRYGARGAAMTANVITYRARSALREVGRVLGFSDEVLGSMSKHLHHFDQIDAETLDKRGKDAGIPLGDERVRWWLDMAVRIQDLPRHLGQHSGGMVIAKGRLDHVVPLEPAAMEGRVVIQWDKDDCADLRILKIDLLGLGMMAVLEEVIHVVNTVEQTPLTLAKIPADDEETYAVLRRADTIGMFQVESRAQMATLPRLKPVKFYDLVVEVALIRPGPIVGQMVHPYLARRAGREKEQYPHEDLRPILKRTLGVPLFQEQLMRVAMVAAGFTGSEAEEVRRAMGSKRSAERMARLESRLRAGMTRNGYTPAAQEEVLRGLLSFAQYGFPESHAASFALLAYASAYLKTHHAAAYCAALLNHWPMGFYHPATVVKDAQRHGVRVRPIDVTRSQWACTRETPPIQQMRLGLRYVQGLRETTGRAIVAAREAAPFASLDDFRRRVRPNSLELDALAELGALCHTDASRPWPRREALWQVRAFAALPEGLFDDVDLAREPAPVPAMTLAERVTADLRRSGVTAGPHVMAFHRDTLHARGVLSAAEMTASPNGREVAVAGVVITRQRPGTAKGFVFLTVEDETGIVNAIVAPPVYEAQRATIVTSPTLVLHGRVQKAEGVVSLKVSRVEAVAHDDVALPPSHDFH